MGLGTHAFVVELFGGGDDPVAYLLEIGVVHRMLNLGGLDARVEIRRLLDDLLVAGNTAGADGRDGTN